MLLIAEESTGREKPGQVYPTGVAVRDVKSRMCQRGNGGKATELLEVVRVKSIADAGVKGWC